MDVLTLPDHDGLVPVDNLELLVLSLDQRVYSIGTIACVTVWIVDLSNYMAMKFCDADWCSSANCSILQTEL